MALPSPTKVSGKHNAIFEAYYRQVDPKGLGAIPAMDAAKFLKKSALSDVVLSRIWDLSDPNGKGCLDKAGFFVALKLVSLAQCGQVINIGNVLFETQNPPKVGDLPKIIPQKIQTVPVGNSDWSIRPMDRLKYENLFETLNPVNGLLAGNNVKKVLLDSKLPMDTLGRIWDLADQDKDGNLDKHEFIVAMHLVYQTLEKRSVPETLPEELQKPKPAPIPRAPSGEGFADGSFVANFPKDIAPPPIPPMPVAMPPPIPPMSRIPPMVTNMPLISTDTNSLINVTTETVDNWVVSASDMVRFESLFRDSDRDRDGLVSGLEVKNVFLQSGVPQNCLAHIWALCDTNQSGKLTLEQFALAMWMVERKRANIEPPEALENNMIPPSLRGIVKGIDEQKPTYANLELEMISKEIDELSKERRMLETDIAQKEADIRIKSGEVRSLQSELDTLTATLKQLENQKGEAQKRLDDLKTQKNNFEDALYQINYEVDLTRLKVNKIRDQCQKQEETINEQEGELNLKRSELQKLKDEEASLEKEYDTNRKELENLTKQLSETQLQISQVRAMVTQLLETQRQMTDALLLCRAAIESNDTTIVSEYSLAIEPDFTEARSVLEQPVKKINENASTENFNVGAITTSNGFNSSTNNFNNGNARTTNFDDDDDHFSSAVGFDDAFAGSAFPIGSAGGGNKLADPFGDNKTITNSAISPVPPGKDDFGSDPFAILHAPTGAGQILSPNTSASKSGPPPRPESPSPALPPKKSKQPPPRPAPPRPTQGPARPAPPTDGFGSSGGGGFADFADFDNKKPSLPPPPPVPFLSSYTLNTQKINNTTITNNSKISKLLNPLNDTTSITNNLQQNRSITPKQCITTTTPIPIITNTNDGIVGGKINDIVTTTILKVSTKKQPIDFSDDPFKDYRYEDPFAIKDPFADDDNDDDDDNNNIDDDLSSEDPFSDDFKNTKNITLHTSLNSLTKSHEFLDNFKVTPVPSPIITKSIDPSPVNTPFIQIENQFANFDAFSSTLNNTKTINTTSTIHNSSNNSHNNNNNNNNNNDLIPSTNNNSTIDFFDAFNDNFKSFDIKNLKTTNSSSAFDAFGDSNTSAFTTSTTINNTIPRITPISLNNSSNNTTAMKNTKSLKIFDDDFNDNNFEDDFFKSTTKTSQINNVNANFAKFDTFSDDGDDNFVTAISTTKLTNLNNFQNLNKLKKPDDFHINNVKLPSHNCSTLGKEDFSKTDNFDADLEEALKRSMTEQ